MVNIETIKIHKYLANLGLGSRRESERWVSEGRVSVNGMTARVGTRITEMDTIRVDGRKVGANQVRHTPKTRVLLYHKQAGEVSARKDNKFPTIFERIPSLRIGRWINVGRLDLNTSGLILFTNHGELANRLMHPRNEVEREYAVRVRGTVSRSTLKRLCRGVVLEDGVARFKSISEGGRNGTNQWFYVTLCEGKKREVRRLWESQDVQVSRLIRIRYGSIVLPRQLKAGQWMELSKIDVQELGSSVHLDMEK